VKVAAAVVVAVTSVFLYPLCHVVFRCGCETMWAGAAERCNVHAKTGEHCPWCEDPLLGGTGFVFILALQATAFVLARSRKLSVPAATFAGVAVLPVAVLLSGTASFLATDYPYFVWKDARARFGIPVGPIRTIRPVGN
jgi:hypothetical protein